MYQDKKNQQVKQSNLLLIVLVISIILMSVSCVSTKVDLDNDILLERLSCGKEDWYIRANMYAHGWYYPMIVHDTQADTWRIGYYFDAVWQGDVPKNAVMNYLDSHRIVEIYNSQKRLVIFDGAQGGPLDLSEQDLNILLQICTGHEPYYIEARIADGDIIAQGVDKAVYAGIYALTSSVTAAVNAVGKTVNDTILKENHEEMLKPQYQANTMVKIEPGSYVARMTIHTVDFYLDKIKAGASPALNRTADDQRRDATQSKQVIYQCQYDKRRGKGTWGFSIIDTY